MTKNQAPPQGGAKLRYVQSALRVRPRKPTEEDDECLKLVPATASVQIPRRDGQWQVFQLDNVYGPDATQRTIFDSNVCPMLDEALTGVNATVVAYGMTGSGKTFTNEGTADHPGIVINTVMYLLAKRTHANVFSFSIWTGEEGRIVVVGLQSVEVGEYTDFQRVYRKATENRATGLRAKNNIVDLAASENNRRTGNKWQQLKESAAIHTSLLTLGKVVDALNEGLPRVPYRESKLTRTLHDPTHV
ncbi:Kinesin-like protein kif22 [Allomyces javanicus]|nr:Kinesin-like protein kif22 [Allomyces javanicus]